MAKAVLSCKAPQHGGQCDWSRSVGDSEGVVEDDIVRDFVSPDIVGFYGSLLGLFLLLSMSWHISQNLSRKQRTH